MQNVCIWYHFYKVQNRKIRQNHSDWGCTRLWNSAYVPLVGSEGWGEKGLSRSRWSTTRLLLFENLIYLHRYFIHGYIWLGFFYIYFIYNGKGLIKKDMGAGSAGEVAQKLRASRLPFGRTQVSFLAPTHNYLTPIPEDSTPSSGLLRHCMHVMCKHTCRGNTPTHKIEVKKKTSKGAWHCSTCL